MTNRELIDSQSPSEIDVDDEAVTFLRDWFPLVRVLPQVLITDERNRAVCVLVAWYERVYEQEEYSGQPPLEGLDALVDELTHVIVPPDVHAELARARWAIGVAEELVRWRSCFRRSGEGSPPTGPATDRLELAIEGGRRQLAEE